MSKAAPAPQPAIVLDEVDPDILASAIVDVSNAAKKLLNSRLSKRAIAILIRDACKGNRSLCDILEVLDAAENLSRRFVVEPKG